MNLTPGTLSNLLIATLIGSTASLAVAGEDAHKHAHASAREQKAWGIAGDTQAASRTILLSMDDRMRFSPDKLSVKLGETVRFVIKNNGKQRHEMVIGTHQELEAHVAMMLKSPDMAHDGPHMAHVKAGQTGSLLWTFNRAGEFEFACTIAGHYQAGMKGSISVKN